MRGRTLRSQNAKQVVQMLFRAILSLLSVPEGITAAGGDYGPNNPRVSSSGMGSRGGSLSSQRSDGNLGKNRWGSFRGRGPEGLGGPPPTAPGMHENPADGAFAFRVCCRCCCSPQNAYPFVMYVHVGRHHLECFPMPPLAHGILTGSSNAAGARNARPAGGPGDRLDETLSLCFRLLRCEPGDRVLHVSLLVVGKVIHTRVPSTMLKAG